MNVSEALQTCADEQGLSDVEIAAAIGVSQVTVNRWLTGQVSPALAQFMALRRRYPRFAELVDRNGEVV